MRSVRVGAASPSPPLTVMAALLALSLAFPLLAGCPSPLAPPPPAAPPPAAQKTAPPRGEAATRSGGTLAGAKFNRFFPPKSAGGYSLVYTQEKEGFASADLSRGGKKVASLSVSDTSANPAARSKYSNAAKQIGGYPAATLGSSITSVLVSDRWQVQVRSNDPSFTATDREAWLQKFDLPGLAGLQ